MILYIARSNIYQLLKGMILNVVLESTHENEHEKQAAQVCSRKLLRKPSPFGLSVSRNLNATYDLPIGSFRSQRALISGLSVH